ncbi:MAG: hypothetical protein LBI60_00465 [Bacteroidales bacterium]|nr:hypothetical protein [Bacteroidales bacterium]
MEQLNFYTLDLSRREQHVCRKRNMPVHPMGQLNFYTLDLSRRDSMFVENEMRPFITVPLGTECG